MPHRTCLSAVTQLSVLCRVAASGDCLASMLGNLGSCLTHTAAPGIIHLAQHEKDSFSEPCPAIFLPLWFTSSTVTDPRAPSSSSGLAASSGLLSRVMIAGEERSESERGGGFGEREMGSLD